MRFGWMALGFYLAGVVPVHGHDTSGSWRSETPLPKPRAEVAVAAHDGFVYVIAGVGPYGPVNTLYIFDAGTETWREGAPLPGPARDHVGAAFVDGMLYAIGGLTYWPGGSIADVYAYDPKVNSWSARSKLPRARGALGIAVVDGLIYALGGLAGGQVVADVTVYDPKANTWRTLAPMPTARDHLMAAALQGKIYAIGGRAREIDAIVDVNEVYDPQTNAWSSKAPLPMPRGGGGAAVLHGKLYVFGGEFAGGTFAHNEAYDPQTDTWEQHAPLPTPRHGTQGVVVNGRIYVPGGGPEAGFSSSEVVDSFFSPAPVGTCPAGGAEDSDSDGHTDATEEAAGTDPCNAAQVPNSSEPDSSSTAGPPDAGPSLPTGTPPPEERKGSAASRTDGAGGCSTASQTAPFFWLLGAGLLYRRIHRKSFPHR